MLVFCWVLAALAAWTAVETMPPNAWAAVGRHLLLEAHKRFVQSSNRIADSVRHRLHDMMATRFRQQTAVIDESGRFIAVLCTRRAGKTELVPTRLFKRADKYPGTVLYYVAITGKRARELMWGPLIQANDKYNLGWKTDATRQTLSRDGTEIRLVGADKMRELEKRRGDKASEVIVDEAQSFPPLVLNALIEDVLGPALADVQGTFVLLGTPGIVCAGRWYSITRNEDAVSRSKREDGWSVHEWSALDNPHVAANIAMEVAERERKMGKNNPTTIREWYGRWVNDTSALFYSYDPRRNNYEALPKGHTWIHVMGVDLGMDDAFAFVVWAFAETCEELYEVDSFSESGLTPSQWVAKVKKASETWNPVSIRVDTGGLGKAIVTEWQTRESLPIEAAEKAHKPAYVKLLNDDLLAGRVKVRANSPLAGEWSVLPKKEAERGKAPTLNPVEDPRFPNHVSDGGLYGWREALHYLGRSPDDEPEKGTPEAENHAAKKRKEAREDKAARAAEAEENDVWTTEDYEDIEEWG